MQKKITIILCIGIILRLFLSFSTFHSDVQPFYFAGSVMAKGNILNFYDYLPNLPLTSPILDVYPTNLFNYPPLVYFSLGPISYMMSLPFGQEILHDFIFDLPHRLGSLELNFLLLALKLPYLLFDISIAFLFLKLFEDSRSKIVAFTLWMLNPVSIYSTYMMGQFDVIPTFLSVLALYLALKRNKFFLAAFFLGLGASFKIFPLLFLVPLALIFKGWTKRIVVVGIGVLTYIATILPFIGSQGFRATALVAGQTTKSFYANLAISGGESIVFFQFFIVLFYLFCLFRSSTTEGLWKRFFVSILLFFVFTHTHPQWMLWLTPFLILDLIKSNFKHWPLVVIIVLVWVGQITFFDPGLSVWLFSPLFPDLYNLPGIWEILGLKLDINSARGFLQTLFVSAAAYYMYLYFPQKQEK